jgi:iron complex outermembrane recepter protein
MKKYYFESASFIVLSIFAPAVAYAQQAKPPAGGVAAASEEPEAADIVVTGSRIAVSGFTTPTPVTAITASELQASQPSTIAAALNNLPALFGAGGPTSNSGTTGGGQNFLNLRSLGTQRTLVLLDGRRFVSSTATSVVDTNLMPSGLVKRVDVITGGASATYGSDAVAGVANFVLDRDFTGVKGSLQKGISQRGDNSEFRATLNAGFGFAGDRGHLVLSGEWFDGGTVAGDARDFRVEGDNFLTITGNTPLRVTTDKVRTTATYGGLIVTGVGGTTANNASFQGIQFGPSGTILPYDYGSVTLGRGTANGTQSGGDGVNTDITQQIVRPLTRRTLFGHLDYEVSDSFSVFAEGSYGKTRTVYDSVLTANTGNFALSIKRDNPYLSATLLQQMIARNVTSLTLTRYATEGGVTVVDNQNETWRAVLGFSGKVGGIKLDGYYSHGQNTNLNPVFNNQITANITRAVDSVLNSSQQIVCRVNADVSTTNDDPACAPYNPFGVGSPSAASLAYINGTSMFNAVNKQDVVSLQASGKLADGWAGPISFAIGGEYRKESVNVTVNAQSEANAFRLANAQAYTGRYDIKEGFLELNLPVLSESPIGKKLELNGAIRYAEYSTGIKATTWKLGANYQLFDGLRFRATRSRDIRAPNLSELFSPGRQGTSNVTDPFNANRTDGPFPTFPSGNVNLRAEKSNALVIGMIAQPRFIPGFSVSVDYYDFKITDAIGAIGPQLLLDECFRGAMDLCANITRDPVTQRITAMKTPTTNLNSLKVRGVDFETSYNFEVGGLGRVNLRGLLGYVDHLITEIPGTTPVNRVSEFRPPNGRTPRWKGLFSSTVKSGGFTGFMQMRYIGGGVYDATFTNADADFNIIKPQAYFDGQISQKVEFGGHGVEFYLNVQNILDHQPPFVPFAGNANQSTQSDLYDQVGRMFRFGINVKF